MYEPFNVFILQYSGTPSPVGYLHREYTTAPTGPAYPSPLLLSSKITKSPRKNTSQIPDGVVEPRGPVKQLLRG